MEDNLFENQDHFNFERNSFLTVGAVLRNSMKLLSPNESKKPQPLFLGDSRGVVYVAEYRKQEPEIKEKTKPFSREITCIDYNIRTNILNEKIFFSFGNSIFITNRKCKEYSKIEFDIADNISQFKATDNLVWTVSNNYLNKYEYGESTMERGTFDCECMISSLALTEFYGRLNPVAICGGEDSKIRIVHGKDVIATINSSSGITCLTQFKSSVNDLSDNYFLYGGSNGCHGLVSIEKDLNTNTTQAANKEGSRNNSQNSLFPINLKPLIFDFNKNKNLSEVVSIKTFDLNYDGVNEIILTRSNGDVNVFSTGNTLMDMSMISKFETKEILTSIDIGKFRSIDENEIMLSSYTGLVFSLTPQLNSINHIKQEKEVIKIDQKTLTKNIKEVQTELEVLKQHLEKKQEEFTKLGSATYNPVNRNPYQSNYKLSLLPKEAAYHLRIESEFPIEMILMQSEGVSLDIIDIPTKDVNVNIIKSTSSANKDIANITGQTGFNAAKANQSIANLSPNENSKFLCTFKFKDNIHQFEILFRTYEGSADLVKCVVMPNNKPKTAFQLDINIKALSLHKKEEDLALISSIFNNEDYESRLNTLTIKGKFQISEINQMFSLIVPDIQEKTTKETLFKYYLKSTFLQTLVEITFDNNICIVKSVFISPLIIIKEQLTKEAAYRKKDLEFIIQPKLMSVFDILEIVNPMIEENFNLETKYKIIQAFKEIDVNRKGEISNLDLPSEYRTILNNSDDIIKKYEQRSINLNYMRILIENLLKDVGKVRTIQNLTQKINDIKLLFEDYSYDNLLQVFKEIKNL